MKRHVIVALALVLVAVSAGIHAGAQPRKGVRVRISFPASARAEAVTGRVYVAIARVPTEGAAPADVHGQRPRRRRGRRS